MHPTVVSNHRCASAPVRRRTGSRPGTAADAARSHARAVGAWVAGLVDGLRRLADRLRREREVRATRRALGALAARDLHDLALDRSEIDSVAAGIADGDATRIHARAARLRSI